MYNVTLAHLHEVPNIKLCGSVSLGATLIHADRQMDRWTIWYYFPVREHFYGDLMSVSTMTHT